MLDPWIIEEIKRREQRRREQPVVQIPLQVPDRDREPNNKDDREENPPRGVEIIDFGIGADAEVGASYSW